MYLRNYLRLRELCPRGILRAGTNRYMSSVSVLYNGCSTLQTEKLDNFDTEIGMFMVLLYMGLTILQDNDSWTSQCSSKTLGKRCCPLSGKVIFSNNTHKERWDAITLGRYYTELITLRRVYCSTFLFRF